MDAEPMLGGQIDDEKMAGTWALDATGMSSDLRSKRRGGRWWFLLVWLALCLVVLGFDIVDLAQGQPHWLGLVSRLVLTVLAAASWWDAALRRHPRFSADRDAVWMGHGLGKRRYRWAEIGSVTYRPSSGDTCQLVVSRNARGVANGRAVTTVAAPVVLRFLSEARRREIDVDSVVGG